VVQPTYVQANAGHNPLPVPIDGGDIASLAEALIQKIQWPKDRILIPPMMRHPNPEATTGSRGTTSDGGTATHCPQEKAQLQHRSRSAKLRNRRDDNSRRSPGKLRLSSSCNMRISNRRNSSLCSSRRSPGNLPLSSRCNMYNSLCNRRRSPGNLHCRRGIEPRNLCLKMRFLTILLGQNRNDQNTSLVHLCCQKQT
jgi:hypothetical protein